MDCWKRKLGGVEEGEGDPLLVHPRNDGMSMVEAWSVRFLLLLEVVMELFPRWDRSELEAEACPINDAIWIERTRLGAPVFE